MCTLLRRKNRCILCVSFIFSFSILKNVVYLICIFMHIKQNEGKERYDAETVFQ